MPKVGTSARLYFPNSDPENAEVTGSVRENGGGCAKTGNPNNRYFGTEHGSELAMLPDKMSISGSKKNLFMSMKNDTGLDFTSHKKIVLNAAEGVYFKTPKKVIINGENSILVTKARQKKGFSLEGEFNFLGANSKIEAKDRTTYPDFNDEPKNDTKAKAAAIAKKKAEAEKKSGFSWGKLALFAVAAVAVVAVAVVAPVAAAVVGAALIGAALGSKALTSSGKLKGLEQKLENKVKALEGLLCGALMGPFSALEKRVEKAKNGIGAELEKFWNSLYTNNPIPEYSDEELKARYPGEYARLMSSKADNERIIKASPIWTRIIPYLGEGIAVDELVNNKDIFTGEKLATGDKVVDGLSLATFGISRVVGKGGAVKAAEIGNRVGKNVFTTTEDAANVLSKELNGTVSQLKNGYKVAIPNGNKPIVVRVMNEGSGGRANPYYRVSIDGKGSLTLDGTLSSDRGLTHIDMTDDYLSQIKTMINKYLGK